MLFTERRAVNELAAGIVKILHEPEDDATIVVIFREQRSHAEGKLERNFGRRSKKSLKRSSAVEVGRLRLGASGAGAAPDDQRRDRDRDRRAR